MVNGYSNTAHYFMFQCIWVIFSFFEEKQKMHFDIILVNIFILKTTFSHQSIEWKTDFVKFLLTLLYVSFKQRWNFFFYYFHRTKNKRTFWTKLILKKTVYINASDSEKYCLLLLTNFVITNKTWKFSFLHFTKLNCFYDVSVFLLPHFVYILITLT